MTLIKSRRNFPRRRAQRNFHRQRARRVFAAGVVAQKFFQATVRVNPAGHAVVGAAHQRQTIFDRAKNCVGEMLPLLCAFAKPAVVREVHEKIRFAHRRRRARGFGKHIFKTNQRSGGKILAGKNHRLIAGRPAALNRREVF